MAKPRKKGARWNPHRAAQGLAEATVRGNSAAARSLNVHPNTIASWWKRLDEGDALLARLYMERLEGLGHEWRHEARLTLLTGMRKCNELIASATTLDDLRDVLMALQTVGELLTQYDALVEDDETPRFGSGGEASPPASDGPQDPPLH